MGPQLSRLGARAAALTAVTLLTGLVDCPPIALALDPPSVDPALVPADGTPGPDGPLRRSNSCSVPITVADPDPARLAPGFDLLGIADAWRYSTGNGVAVAVIDTGVTPGPRLPVIAGGDYLTGGADGPPGLQDCDAHGTIAASIIAAAPQGAIPMPRPMPEVPAFPPPAGVPEPPPPDPPADDGAPDGVVGVAPHARIISIRQSSRAFEPAGFTADEQVKAGTLATLAKAVVHAADLGAKVINISVTSCTPAGATVDQQTLGAALWYAATVKDAVIVTAAGNVGEAGCANNPMFDPLDPGDPRDWHQVRVISSPSWFADYVLSVGGVDTTGAPLDKSMTGPWVGVAAPATQILGLSPQGGGPVNAYPPPRAGEPAIPFWGTSFSAAYVSGVAALVRAKYPDLTAHQVIERIVQTAHNPPAGVDNRVGYGLVDPVAALTFDVRPGHRVAPGAETRVLHPVPPPPPPDHRARSVALGFLGVVALAAVGTAITDRIRRATR
ncbi:type VII secretion-associated serine protease mycosin [Mycobacterium sp. M1]|uniref:Type VII secretion-associated serine protease mycosin n=1 Tax=Mycolicibacter acidiphilus TaxID=2835306 RepID=A0ABS5RI01_9MYCO|nr:type VII secretion-associated serine protease mycosin [Mycolicibacter acidiphilus]MBS9533819.1 type VII secretion-associated serine protease mycosin [Mycolicibacter acidiphilus]